MVEVKQRARRIQAVAEKANRRASAAGVGTSDTGVPIVTNGTLEDQPEDPEVGAFFFCGCASSGGAGHGWAVMGLLALAMRRRRSSEAA